MQLIDLTAKKGNISKTDAKAPLLVLFFDDYVIINFDKIELLINFVVK